MVGAASFNGGNSRRTDKLAHSGRNSSSGSYRVQCQSSQDSRIVYLLGLGIPAMALHGPGYRLSSRIGTNRFAAYDFALPVGSVPSVAGLSGSLSTEGLANSFPALLLAAISFVLLHLVVNADSRHWLQLAVAIGR